MTVYGLIEQLVTHCGPNASFGDVKVWWSESEQRLYLSRAKPIRPLDVKELST